MNTVDAMLQQSCPSGVAHKRLSDLARTVSGLKGKTKADFASGSARYVTYKNVYANPAVDQAATELVELRPDEKQNRLHLGDVVITGSSENVEDVGMSSVVVTEPHEPLYLNSFCFALRFEDPNVLLPEFSKYLFRSEFVRGQIRRAANGVTRINVSKDRFMKIRIPVPPAEVQRAIAEVLDNLDDLQAAIRAELNSEFEARRAQHLHHRRSLLDLSRQGEVRTLLLGEVVRNRDSERRPITRAARESGEYPYYGANGVQDHVASYLFDGTYLLMGEDGSVMDSHGHPVLNWAEGQIWVNNHAHVLEEDHADVRLRYLFHYLQVADIRPYVTGGMQPKLNQGNMNRIPVPVPPVGEQDRIVGALDELDLLVKELTTELAAEGRARRMQFEHYRDALCVFANGPVVGEAKA